MTNKKELGIIGTVAVGAIIGTALVVGNSQFLDNQTPDPIIIDTHVVEEVVVEELAEAIPPIEQPLEPETFIDDISPIGQPPVYIIEEPAPEPEVIIDNIPPIGTPIIPDDLCAAEGRECI